MSYTTKDKYCAHCGGDISAHYAGKIIYWCDKCGSNDRNVPPSVSIKFYNTKDKELKQ